MVGVLAEHAFPVCILCSFEVSALFPCTVCYRWGRHHNHLNNVPPRPLTPTPLPAAPLQSDHRTLGTTCDSGAKREVPFDGDMTYDDFCFLGKMAFGPPDGML